MNCRQGLVAAILNDFAAGFAMALGITLGLSPFALVVVALVLYLR